GLKAEIVLVRRGTLPARPTDDHGDQPYTGESQNDGGWLRHSQRFRVDKIIHYDGIITANFIASRPKHEIAARNPHSAHDRRIELHPHEGEGLVSGNIRHE